MSVFGIFGAKIIFAGHYCIYAFWPVLFISYLQGELVALFNKAGDVRDSYLCPDGFKFTYG